ncbi:MAG: DNA-directed RNA polymerase subunit alpha [Nitrospiraceae bacterium]|nr:MAG: DNA-directed RNA polymerase subunit alpha [Nitrospiraceae bacterium]
MDLKKKGFQLPEHVSFDNESLTNTYGKLYVEAFERGFGTTVGNALRRVLISSIEGAAVTSVRIPGVLHEFSTLNGVKEDVVDIVLNVKQLRMKLHGDEPRVISINFKGPGAVKAKDIDTGGQVEVLNPEQHIATVEKNINFKMEMNVEKGKGYVTADMNKKADQPVDTIAIDSIFTPVKKVNFWIEGARVGRSTDYDKLVMEIWTDGSITPRKAVTHASGILMEHLSLFSLEEEPEIPEPVLAASGETGETGEEDPAADVVEEVYDYDPAEVNDNLLKSVEELELSVRSYNCLRNANIHTIAELVQKSEQEMLRTKNFGWKSLNEIKEIILSMGLHFNMRIDPEELEKLAKAKRSLNAS